MRTRLLTLAIAALLLPTAASTWRVAGVFEPDTDYDDETWMYQDPPPPGSQRVYMNGIAMSRAGPVGVTPNVALLETRNEPPVVEFHYVLVGVWADCNQDGYIGAAEQGVREYSAALLSSTSVCPPSTGPNNAWPAGAHNYNGWVSELIHIGPQGRFRIYSDADIRVWGDFERPDHAPMLGQCPSYPHPKGTYQSTGGFLNFVGCHLDRRGIETLHSANQAMDLFGDPLGLKFQDEHDATSGPLGQQQTFGSEDTQYSPAYVWDCDGEGTYVGTVGVAKIDPKLGSAPPSQWTIPAFYNHTYEGIRPLDNCDPTDQPASGFYALESDDYNAVNPRNKTESDWNFKFPVAPRGGPPGGTIFGGGPAGAPPDAGVGWTSYGHNGWYAENLYGAKLGPNMIRANLTHQGLGHAFWATYYAHLGAETFQRGFEVPDGEGRYGSWHCGGVFEGGIRNGWNCDPDMWYRNVDGSPYPDPEHRLARLGWTYHLRDVDCYDGSNALGIHTAPPAYGPEPCP